MSEDHNYNLKFPSTSRFPKRINKNTRLQTSLQITQKQLQQCKDRTNLLEKYCEHKMMHNTATLRQRFRENRIKNMWWVHLNH